MEESGWIDVSVPVYDGMVHWPGDPPVRIKRVKDMEKGNSHNLSEIQTGVHVGTHIDAPVHFIEGGVGIDKMPFDVSIGPARIIEIRNDVSITREELVGHDIQPGERILFRTRNSVEAWDTNDFYEHFVYISEEAANYLAGLKVRLVGVDYLSVGPAGGGTNVHRTLLEAGIWILEGLNLGAVTAGEYELVCLPLRLKNGDGGPARAAVRKIERG